MGNGGNTRGGLCVTAGLVPGDLDEGGYSGPIGLGKPGDDQVGTATSLVPVTTIADNQWRTRGN
jgi:hypothetical protein